MYKAEIIKEKTYKISQIFDKNSEKADEIDFSTF